MQRNKFSAAPEDHMTPVGCSNQLAGAQGIRKIFSPVSVIFRISQGAETAVRILQKGYL